MDPIWAGICKELDEACDTYLMEYDDEYQEANTTPLDEDDE